MWKAPDISRDFLPQHGMFQALPIAVFLLNILCYVLYHSQDPVLQCSNLFIWKSLRYHPLWGDFFQVTDYPKYSFTVTHPVSWNTGSQCLMVRILLPKPKCFAGHYKFFPQMEWDIFNFPSQLTKLKGLMFWIIQNWSAEQLLQS